MNARHGAATRERILKEAEHLIHLRGYRCTSLEDIARRCRMTKANLLHHFRSKEALGLAVLDYKIGCYRRCCLEPLFSGALGPAEAVRELFAMAGRFHRDNGCRAGCFVANVGLEMSDQDDRFREKVARFFEEWAGVIERALRRGGCAEPAGRAEAVLSLYEGAVLLARTRRDIGVFDRLGRVAARLAVPREAISGRNR